jgi:hypothetical protein
MRHWIAHPPQPQESPLKRFDVIVQRLQVNILNTFPSLDESPDFRQLPIFTAAVREINHAQSSIYNNWSLVYRRCRSYAFAPCCRLSTRCVLRFPRKPGLRAAFLDLLDFGLQLGSQV